jgi:putative membrane protein
MQAHRPFLTAALLLAGAALAQKTTGTGPTPSTSPPAESPGSMTTTPGLSGTGSQTASDKVGGQAMIPPTSSYAGTTPSPKTILAELHMANQAEIEMGKMAEQKAQDKEVKKFGRRMVKAHTEMDKEAQTWAKKNRVTIASPLQDDAHRAAMQTMQQTMQRLESLSGAEFDRAYVQAMAEDHANDLNKVRTFEQQTANESLQKLLEKARKEIASHKRDADKLVQKLGATAAR